MTQTFFSKLNSAIEMNHSLLCVGLDPRTDKLSADLKPGETLEERLVGWGKAIIDQTSDLVCCYKPNFAFYEQCGTEGLRALQRTIAAVPETVPVLLDVKRGDIGSTAQAYARAAYEQWGADAVTISPYLGEDSVKPFLDYEGKAVFLLCHTSNPSAEQVQHHGEPPLFEYIAQTAQGWGGADRIGLVIGATQPKALAAVRAMCPENWFLAPGVGAQGGDLAEALRAGLRADGSGMIIPVSRGVIQAEDPRQAALELRDLINRVRAEVQPAAPRSFKENLIGGLFEAGCVKFGSFTLASGKQSPIYVDLRRVVSYPSLFKMVAFAYSEIVKSLDFDRVAGVPYAALPTAAVVSWKLGRPMIYPRKEVKQHGTGQNIEGDFAAGQTAVMLEDVITSGGSIVKAADTLREAGLVVRDVVVLVDREQGGHEKMAEIGLRLHAVLTIGEILETLKKLALIDAKTFEEVKAYLAA